MLVIVAFLLFVCFVKKIAARQKEFCRDRVRRHRSRRTMPAHPVPTIDSGLYFNALFSGTFEQLSKFEQDLVRDIVALEVDRQKRERGVVVEPPSAEPEHEESQPKRRKSLSNETSPRSLKIVVRPPEKKDASPALPPKTIVVPHRPSPPTPPLPPSPASARTADHPEIPIKVGQDSQKTEQLSISDSKST